MTSRKIIERRLSVKGPYKGRHPTWGVCHPDGVIEIDPRLRPRNYMDTMIHELLHRQFPCLSEDSVTCAGTIIAETLWKHGFRRIPDAYGNF